MKIDKFTIFACYKPEEQDLLNKYISPDVECSSFKGVPIKLYGQFMKMLPKRKGVLDLEVKAKDTTQDLEILSIKVMLILSLSIMIKEML